jgi:hypothetical protein
MHIPTFFPMSCAFVAFVLSMLCIFVGNKPGYMEDYHMYDSLRISSPLLTQLPQFNTSTLGQNLVSKTSSSSSASDTSLESLSRSISSDLNGVLGDVADELASELGIKQWYSWHLMDMCEGTFTPNATASGAQLNVSSCTNQTALCRSSPPLPTRSSSWK